MRGVGEDIVRGGGMQRGLLDADDDDDFTDVLLSISLSPADK